MQSIYIFINTCTETLKQKTSVTKSSSLAYYSKTKAMKKEDGYIEEVNDETPDNYTEFGNGHKLKKKEKYTDGEPPHEEEEEPADPDKPYQQIPKKKYP